MVHALKALAEPRRRELLELLRDEGPLAVGELAERVDVTQQAVSQHLKVLEAAELVEARREGTRHVYAVRPEGFRPVQEFVATFWDVHLARLRRAVEDGVSYRHTLDLAAPPERVFDHFVRPELLVKWMGDRAELRAVDGGEWSVDINGVLIRGHFVRVERPHLVEIAWGELGNPHMPPGSTQLVVRLEATDTGTRLHLEHRGLVPAEADKHAIGWPHFLDRLAVRAAGGDPGPDPWAASPPG